MTKQFAIYDEVAALLNGVTVHVAIHPENDKGHQLAAKIIFLAKPGSMTCYVHVVGALMTKGVFEPDRGCASDTGMLMDMAFGQAVDDYAIGSYLHSSAVGGAATSKHLKFFSEAGDVANRGEGWASALSKLGYEVRKLAP